MGSEKTPPKQIMDDAHGNKRTTIMREIAHIHFIALAQLDLSGNRIGSIEGLAWMQMPHLCTLYLYGNNITFVIVVRKATWPSLQQLNIWDNNFGDAKSLTVGCFPQIQQLNVYEFQGDMNTFTEQCFPSKMQAACLKLLDIRKSKFCCDRSIAPVLQQRWPHIEIY